MKFDKEQKEIIQAMRMRLSERIQMQRKNI